MATVTTSTATLGLELTLNSLPRTFNTDVILNVYRRHEAISYRSKDTIDAANVAFFGSKELISTSALHIADRSISIVTNRIDKLDKPVKIEDMNEYTVPTDKFIVTDVYTAEDNGNNSEALFYQHTISIDNLPRVSSSDDLTIDSDYKLTSVEVLDINFNSLRLDNIKINYEEGIVYNNLISSFDQENDVASVYYIRYSVKDNVNKITSFVELVNNKTIFSPADFSDLDMSFNIIDDGRKVYLAEENESELIIKLPHIGNYSFQLLEDARIKIIPPPQSDVDDVWNLSITNGKIFNTIDGIGYKYSIAEFANQNWNPEQPLKKATLEDAEFISENLIKVRKENVLYNPTISGFIDVLVYDDDNSPLAAFTTNPSLEGEVASNSKLYEMWSPGDKTGIRSVDGKVGIVDLDGFKLRSDYKIKASYNYEETNYEFTRIDFNPVNNPDVLIKSVSLFIDPDSNDSSKLKTLYYTVADRSGKIVKSNLTNFSNDDAKIRTDDGLWRDVYYENVPSYITDAIGSILFLDQYTVVGSGVFLPLGDVFVSEDSHPDLSTIIDVRSPGGGIKESEMDSAKSLQQEVEWYWDIGFWDGIPYPGGASYFVEVPISLLEIAGGVFKTNEIKDAVDRHTAAGVYAIVKAYGIDPVISGVIPGSGLLTIKWGSYT